MNYSTKSTGYTQEQLIQNVQRCLEAVGHIPHEHRGQVYGGCASPFEDKAVILPVLVWHRKRTARDPRHAEQDVKSEIYSDKAWSLQGALNYFKRNSNPDTDAVRFLAEVAGSQSITQPPARSPEEQYFEALNRASNVDDLDLMGQKSEGRSIRDDLLSKYRESLAPVTNPLLKEARLPPALTEHPYFIKKGLTDTPQSAAFRNWNKIYIPFTSAWKMKHRATQAEPRHLAYDCLSYQTIDHDGVKLFCQGTKTSGLFHPIGELYDASTVLLVEGWATGMTAYAATGYPVACVGSKSNFVAVAASLAECRIVGRYLLIGDADAGETMEKAYKALMAGGVRAKYILTPGGGNTDLNDLALGVVGVD